MGSFLVDSESATVKTHQAYSVLRGEEQLKYGRHS